MGDPRFAPHLALDYAASKPIVWTGPENPLGGGQTADLVGFEDEGSSLTRLTYKIGTRPSSDVWRAMDDGSYPIQYLTWIPWKKPFMRAATCSGRIF